ncbi:hypothetical protein PCARR_a0208 [Pseudoalteromonas carrageenovora IAM 12662]|uniref:Uncharacterized protein n=1 Tax=Pseudoalteromonas carrageenovora IAM 12662 TaxID=1314868 RepID=A0ABR9ENG6_PSEVC|nr:hypothetical protein [Pseudoalteromonas carrageenovora IAM 12662]
MLGSNEQRAAGDGRRATGYERLGVKFTCRRLACWRIGLKM